MKDPVNGTIEKSEEKAISLYLSTKLMYHIDDQPY